MASMTRRGNKKRDPKTGRWLQIDLGRSMSARRSAARRKVRKVTQQMRKRISIALKKVRRTGRTKWGRKSLYAKAAPELGSMSTPRPSILSSSSLGPKSVLSSTKSRKSLL